MIDVKFDLDSLVRLLKKQRETLSMTKSDLAQKAFAAKANYITQIEEGYNNHSRLTYENFYLLCEELKLEPNALMKDINKSRSQGFIIVKGSSLFDGNKYLQADSPMTVYRNGNVIEKETVQYYSLLDHRQDVQEIVTDFQMVLAKWEPNAESKYHYQLGEEFLFVFDGSIQYTFLSQGKKGNIQAGNWCKTENLSKDSENFMCLAGWFPHKAKAGRKGAYTLIVTNDPRGEAGIMSYRSKDIEKGSVIFDGDKLSYQSLLRGLGIKIKMARFKSGLSSSSVAKKLDMPASELYKIENYYVNPRIETVLKLAKLLDIPVKELFPPVHSPYFTGKLFSASERIQESIKKIREYAGLKLTSFSNEVVRSSDHKGFNSKLSVAEVIVNENDLEPDMKVVEQNRDIAFIVIKGTFIFYNLSDNKEYPYETNLLTEGDTVYIKKGVKHFFKSKSSLVASKALLVYKSR